MVPYDDLFIYPTISAAKNAVKDYCEKEKLHWKFIGDEVAEIDGKTYDILRGYGLRGTYAIRCRERWSESRTGYATGPTSRSPA